MFKKIINTGNDHSLFILRVVLGIVLMAHGLQKHLAGSMVLDGTILLIISQEL